VNIAGFVAANCLRGDVEVAHADRLEDGLPVLDVRTPPEFAAGHVPGAVNIPLDELRNRMGAVPRGERLAVCCAVGLRGYLACRILGRNGRVPANVSGGYAIWCQHHPELAGRVWTGREAAKLRERFCSSPERLPER